MGEDGTENTSGYMNVGDVPSFKVFDSSENEFVDMNFYNHYPNSEDISWYNLATIQLDQLINDDYYFINASDFENTATITSIFTDDIYEMGLGDILVGYLDDEIRSIAISTNNDISSGYVFFSSIFLNQKINNYTFKYYNYENNLIFNIGQSFTFNVDDNFGNALEPIILTTESNQLGVSSQINLLDDFYIIDTYPNPFNPIVNINLNIKNNNFLDISIIDINGKEIDKIFKGYKNSGNYHYQWNASGFPSGIYTIIIKEIKNKGVISEKICLIK